MAECFTDPFWNRFEIGIVMNLRRVLLVQHCQVITPIHIVLQIQHQVEDNLEILLFEKKLLACFEKFIVHDIVQRYIVPFVNLFG